MKTSYVTMIILLIAAFTGGVMVQAASSKPKKKAQAKVTFKQTYDAGMKLVKSGKYGAARAKFVAAEKLNEDNPDALNMIAYTSRKLGQLDVAFEYYALALEQRDEFPEAREYLAEAHLQAALVQARELERYGDKGKQALEDLRAAFQKAAKTVAGDEDMARIETNRW